MPLIILILTNKVLNDSLIIISRISMICSDGRSACADSKGLSWKKYIERDLSEQNSLKAEIKIVRDLSRQPRDSERTVPLHRI